MKKQIFILMLLLIVNFLYLYSEDHTPHPFFKEGKEWLMCLDFGEPWCCEPHKIVYYTVTVKGDSVIAGIGYKKLYYTEISESQSSVLMGLFLEKENGIYVSSKEQLFAPSSTCYLNWPQFILKGEEKVHTPEYIQCYDFSLNVGDTAFYLSIEDNFHQSSIVRSVEEQYGRKIINLERETWIEGIGSTQAFLPRWIDSTRMADIGGFEKLLRCTEDGVVIYEGGHLYDTPAGLSSESIGGDNDIDIICDEKGILLLADRDLCGSVYRIHTLTGECITTGFVDTDSRIDYVLPNNELHVLTIETDERIITKKVMR